MAIWGVTAILAAVVGAVAQKLMALSRGKRRVAILITLLVVGVSSAFINNALVVVLFIPIVFSLSCEYGFSPSKILLPMSYISILAGTCTLIGTSTNIIISDLSARHGYGFITMFELAALGVPNAVVGGTLIFFAARYLMPTRAAPVCETRDRDSQRYLAEVVLRAESPFVGQTAAAAFEEDYPSILPIEIIRQGRMVDPIGPSAELQSDDLLFIKGSASDLISLLKKKGTELPHVDPGTDFDPDEEELIAELIVPPQSELLRQPLMSTDLQGDPEIQIIAVCFGSSACFATPIGYKTNLMVFGPGRYRFSDYFKLGIPLNILVIVSGSLFIPDIWQF